MSHEQLIALMAEHWPEHALNDSGPPEERFDMHEILRMCGCGDPYAAARWVAGMMRDLPWVPDDPAKWFVAYELHERGWTEHGGSVPGWLTDKGKAALVVLDYFVAQEQPYEP